MRDDAGMATAHPSPSDDAELVLGIDPGLQRTGYALLAPAPTPREGHLVEAGVIRLRREHSLTERLIELEDALSTLLTRHHPQALACEELYAHYRHPRTAILMAHARGIILACAARHGLQIISIAATNVKKLLTGNGHAGKRQMQLAVAATLRLPALPEPSDVADAIAIALAGARLRAATSVVAKATRRARA